jgi:hypothetical protein
MLNGILTRYSAQGLGSWPRTPARASPPSRPRPGWTGARSTAASRAGFETKLDAVDAVLIDARLDSAPIAVALHRFVEGIIAVVRRYPIDQHQMPCDTESYARMLEQRAQIGAFLRRAMDEGLIRSDLPDGMAQALLHQIITMLAKQFDGHDPARAADIAVDTLLSGIGRRDGAGAETPGLNRVGQLVGS